MNDRIKNDIDNILGEVERLKGEGTIKDEEIVELKQSNECLGGETDNLRTQMEEIVRYANELNDRINQGIQEIGRCREAIGVYEQ